VQALPRAGKNGEGATLTPERVEVEPARAEPVERSLPGEPVERVLPAEALEAMPPPVEKLKEPELALEEEELFEPEEIAPAPASEQFEPFAAPAPSAAPAATMLRAREEHTASWLARVRD